MERGKYGQKMAGLPEWGIRHAYRPSQDNPSWGAPYRAVNGGVTPGFAPAAMMMGGRELWNHEAFFNYQDRYVNHPDTRHRGTNRSMTTSRNCGGNIVPTIRRSGARSRCAHNRSTPIF